MKLSRKEKGIVRQRVFDRAEGRCEDCGIGLIYEAGSWSSMHAAHIKSKGAGGEFTEDNLRCLCLNCHLVGMHNPKSVPRKS